MAFLIDEEKDYSKKQHLNLSTFAYEVVLNDMFTFGKDNLSGFINTVFEYYSPIAEASISRTLNHFRGELSKCMSGVSGDEKTKKKVLEKLLSQKKDSLVKKAESYEKAVGFKFSLNNKNLDCLSEPNSECEEQKYYSKRGKYIKSVLEEYARLPYIEREKVYFSAYISEIEEAIQKERQLRIKTDKGALYSVYPYKILGDPLSIANYLVGYSTKYECPEDEKQPCSFKISALKSVKTEKSKSAFLEKSKWKELSKIISSRGVQFMVGNEAEIHVKLTEDGVNKYRRQTHLRPHLVEKQGDTYIFQCTTAQAEFYFFKFGKDAQILSPAELREKFKAMYEDAAKIYSD